MRAQLLDDRIHVVRISLLQRYRGGSRDAGLFVVQLRLHFIHCQSARPHPATDIREPNRFQKTLHGAVFPIFPMQTEKSNVERTVDQTFQILLVGRIELRNGISGFFKGPSRAFGRCERHLAFPALSSGEQRHAAFRHASFFHHP